MKKFLLLCVWGLSATLLHAQTVREEIARNPLLSANNYLAYPEQPLTAPSKAPRGYKPFYISHYGRHGSRYLINDSDYQKPLRLLGEAYARRMLTGKGREVLDRIKRIAEDASGRHGELTRLGASQHRGIARRMMSRFPQVFKGNAVIDARSSTVVRCILSMENALQEMVSRNPKLRITHDASAADMCYLHYTDKALHQRRLSEQAQTALKAFADRYTDNSNMAALLFADAAYGDSILTKEGLGYALFKIASNVQNTALSRQMTLYDLFTDRELYNYWQQTNAWWYVYCGETAINGGVSPYSQCNLLRNIIETADTCITRNGTGATLRYGHEIDLLPLVCLMELDDYGYNTTQLETLSERNWCSYRVFPMAGNIQMIFYRNAKQPQKTLVKVLLNEQEAALPIAAYQGKYYLWDDVKRYYLSKIDAFK